MRLHGADDLVHDLGGFAHSQAAQRIAVQVILGDLFHVLHAQVQVGTALVDAEQQLIRVDGLPLMFQAGHLGLAAQQPAGGAGTAVFGVIILGRVFDALVKGHGDGGAQVCLDLHALLRAHKDLVAVQVGMEGHALLGNVAQLGQAEYLKAAAVGQNGAVPAGKLVQAAHIGHDLVAGAQMQVVGVAQHDLGADILEVKGGKAALDGAGSGDIHKRRGLYGAVHRFKDAAAGMALLFEQTIRHWSLL